MKKFTLLFASLIAISAYGQKFLPNDGMHDINIIPKDYSFDGNAKLHFYDYDDNISVYDDNIEVVKQFKLTDQTFSFERTYVTKTREVYEKALETVTEDHVKDIALRFADLETKLGEIERARAIFVYASQYCNPKVQITFWELWREFEAHHGNTDTFKEMQRMKRSVEAEFMQVRY